MRNIRDPTVLSPSSPLPPLPTSFFGRDAIIDDLLGLAGRSASLTLFGAGGNGKTAMALTLLHHEQIAAKFGKHRHFIYCDSLMNSLDGFLERLSDAIDLGHTADMEELRSRFGSSPPCMLVLDGVDSILDTLAPGAAEITTAIEEFGRCKHICLIATSRMDIRIQDFRHIEVPTLPADGARDAFYDRCRMGRSTEVDKLLTDLDFHPLSIELLAGAVLENSWDESGLLKAWNDSKANVLTESGRQSLEDTIQSILLTPTIQGLGITARQTLEAIAPYPSGVRESKLESRFSHISGVGEAANALCKFSLLYRQDGFVKMLSPFRFYFLESIPTQVEQPESYPTRDSIVEDIQYPHRYPLTPGLSSISFLLQDVSS